MLYKSFFLLDDGESYLKTGWSFGVGKTLLLESRVPENKKKHTHTHLFPEKPQKEIGGAKDKSISRHSTHGPKHDRHVYP